MHKFLITLSDEKHFLKAAGVYCKAKILSTLSCHLFSFGNDKSGGKPPEGAPHSFRLSVGTVGIWWGLLRYALGVNRIAGNFAKYLLD